ncbi:hypothetical protein Aduo_009987 [Ancylostoma duodenale]
MHKQKNTTPCVHKNLVIKQAIRELMYMHTHTGKQPSFFCGVFRIVVSSLAAALVAILFIVVYVALSELHRDNLQYLAVDVHAVLKVSNELLTKGMVESALWMLDGTVACICLFLILE